ncbi:MAG: acyltransferase family protein [Gammaproteobacteria bacterium]|nr:acyltransferase family protein [Gammaproteobacteria bacterium]
MIDANNSPLQAADDPAGAGGVISAATRTANTDATRNPRRHDIDWLRVIAVGVLLFYHSACFFQPWAKSIGFIQHAETMDGLWAFVSLFNGWRIPLLFVVSGMGIYLALARRRWAVLFADRSLRLLVPLLFGMTLIVPAGLFLFQAYYGMDYRYFAIPLHLWFLINIYVYLLILSPFILFTRGRAAEVLRPWVCWALCSRVRIYLLALPLVLESHLMDPDVYVFYALNMHGFWLGLIVFTYGYLFLWLGESMRRLLREMWVVNLCAGLLLYALKLLYFDLVPLQVLSSLDTFVWLLAIVGAADRFLNRPSAALTHLSEVVFPIYIVHVLYLTLGAYYLFPLDLPAWAAFSLLFFGCCAASYLTYRLFVVYLGPARLLFGVNVGWVQDR